MGQKTPNITAVLPRKSPYLTLLFLMIPLLLSSQGAGFSNLKNHARDPGFAKSSLPPIRVVCDDNYPPYSFRSETGEIQGIIPDQWRAFSEETGRPVDFKAMNWALALKIMQEGGADVLDSAFETPERSASFDFLPAYANIRVPLFFHRSISGLSKVEDLRGFRVGVKAGDAAITVLERYGIRDLIKYSSYEEIILAAKDRHVRVFCVDEPPALYFVNKYGLEQEFRQGFLLYTGQFHRAIQKNRSPLADGADLYRVLMDGFSGISSDTYREINDRWMGKPLIQVVDWRPLVAVATVAIFLIGLLVAFSLALRSQVRRKTAELVETNRELLASQRRNRAFIAALPDLFYITDAQGRYLEFITSNRALLYKEEDQCLGKRITEVMASTGISDLLMGALRAVVQGSPLEIVEYGLPINGEPKRFECRVVKIEDDRILFIVRDSTQPWIVMRELEKSLEEKEILLREIHHRVKNNLQVVSSLIHLESSSFDSEKDRLLLEETQQRIASMAQVHELLYRSENLSSIDGGTYIQRLYDELSSAYIDVSSAVTTRIDADSVELNLDTAIPLGLIINEIVTNAFKYAFLGRREGTLDIIFKQQADGFRSLTIADDGPGLGEGWEDRLTDSLGITLIRSLSEQLRGKLTIENGSPRGVRIRLVF